MKEKERNLVIHIGSSREKKSSFKENPLSPSKRLLAIKEEPLANKNRI